MTDTAESGAREKLFTRSFLVVLVLTLLGFTLEHILRPVVPLIVIDLGGSTVLVGAIAAIHSIPSILFRPLIGRLADSWNQGLLLRVGASLSAIAPFGLLVASVVFLVPARFVQGTAWALYSVSTHSLMARRSPHTRRGEAAGYFMAMSALAHLIGPAVGVALYLSTGAIGPTLVAAALGTVASILAFRMHLPRLTQPVVEERPTRLIERLIEPSALPATLMIGAFMLPQSLFAVFPPVYALAVGAPLGLLTVYYPVYGLVSFVSQLVAGRASDRYGRHAAIVAGSLVAVVGLAVALVGGGMLTFTIGAAVYALGVSLVSPTMSALTIDRAPPERLGAAMATYSVGYQISSGVGSLLWGVVLSVGGFPAAFVAAIACELGTVAISTRVRSSVERSVDN